MNKHIEAIMPSLGLRLAVALAMNEYIMAAGNSPLAAS